MSELNLPARSFSLPPSRLFIYHQGPLSKGNIKPTKQTAAAIENTQTSHSLAERTDSCVDDTYILDEYHESDFTDLVCSPKDRS